MHSRKQYLLFLVFSLFVLLAGAQLPGGFNLNQLSDAQLIQFAQANGLMGLSETELEAKAKEKGLSADQIEKLKARVQAMGGAATLNGMSGKAGETPMTTEKPRTKIGMIPPKTAPDLINGLAIFGSEIFTKENLTFEPNINIPTPRNYVLGAGDEIKIDVYGYSDKSQAFKVSPDGNIRYPNIGPVKLAGLAIDEARNKLSSVLSKIYPGLQSGNTSLQISLGQIRSIRVNLIGEIRQPGQYTLSSLSTIANALYAAGGPSLIGSYRNISLVRSGKTIAQFDLYQYLLKGDLSANKLLQDEDVVVVSPYSKRVEIRGAIKRPAIYELSPSDHLSQAIEYAGGLADNANKSFVRVSRFGNQENEIQTVGATDAPVFAMQSGDKLQVDSISGLFKNRVIIKGAVYYQGEFALEKVSTLKDLLLLAKPKEEAYTARAVLNRLQADYSPEMVGFSIDDVLKGKFNVNLRREDSVHIYPINETKEVLTVMIEGEINKPGSFNYAKGMKVQDIVLLAGGYKESATKKIIQVSRRIRDTATNVESPLYSIVSSFDLSRGIGKNELNTVLEPFDMVTVRKAPGYKEQVSVSVEGEVVYPGNYTITSNQEKLSDLIKRAGGLKQGGFAEGAILLRRTQEGNTNNSDQSKQNVLQKNKIAALKASSKDTLNEEKATELLNEDYKVVGIRLADVLQRPGSLYDVILEEGDVLKVPKKVETVQTFSGVYFPKKIVYRQGMKVRQVIRESGGVVPGGEKTKAYVIYPNGEVKATKQYLFFSKFPKVKPGAEIYVPVKKDGRKLTSAEILGITTGLATLATMVITISNLTK